MRDAGFRDWDTYTPFPVHGIDAAMGIKMTILPWIVSARPHRPRHRHRAPVVDERYDYPWIISGKPFWSIPANVPIMFELTVLFSALHRAGRHADAERPAAARRTRSTCRSASPRSTDDRFFLLIQAATRSSTRRDTRALLDGTTPLAIEEVLEDRTHLGQAADRPGLRPDHRGRGVARAVRAGRRRRATRSAEPAHPSGRRHGLAAEVQGAARRIPFFADGRADREPVPGTVAVGELREDDHFYRGKADGVWARTFPPQFEISDAVHGARPASASASTARPATAWPARATAWSHKRADALAARARPWVPPTNLTQDHLRNSRWASSSTAITHGIRNMPAYGPQIDVEDRWAIVLYVRALQKSRSTQLASLSDSERGSLK